MRENGACGGIVEARSGTGDQMRRVPGEVPDWRERVVSEALDGAGDGMGGDVLRTFVAALRRHMPGGYQAIVPGVRLERALEILREERTSVSEAIEGGVASYTGVEESFRAYLGWYTLHRSGAGVELLSLPTGGPEQLVFASCSRETAEAAAELVGRVAKRPRERCMAFSGGAWRDAPGLEREARQTAWEDLVLPAETVATLRLSVESFFEHAESYRGLGIPWRRGLLLVGPPGTGKTLAVKALAAVKPELPFLYVRDLDIMGGARSVGSTFERARGLAPAILVFEDIDGLLNEATRSVFLNRLDGFESNEGLLVVATSNHPEKVDEALLKRPSRFDQVVHLGVPDLPERERYLGRLLSARPVSDLLSAGPEAAARRLAGASGGLAPAHLKEAVVPAMLQALRQERHGNFEEAVLDHLGRLRDYLKSADSAERLGELRGPRGAPGFGP